MYAAAKSPFAADNRHGDNETSKFLRTDAGWSLILGARLGRSRQLGRSDCSIRFATHATVGKFTATLFLMGVRGLKIGLKDCQKFTGRASACGWNVPVYRQKRAVCRKVELLLLHVALHCGRNMTLHAVSMPTVAEAVDSRVAMSVRSRVPGRERWNIPVLRDNPALCAAVELVLRGDPGVIDAHASSSTGSLLLRFEPGRIADPSEQLIRSALSLGPLNLREMRMSSGDAGRNALRSFFFVELGCVLLKSALLAGRCVPGGAIAAATMFLVFHRHE
ncbi:MAG: Lipid export ATP-binding/permease protein MsbA [Bryobacterales bacterium]|nr:Lipid export ATP-binding/permease protein MsbA [Bryobacterales bacterium]